MWLVYLFYQAVTFVLVIVLMINFWQERTPEGVKEKKQKKYHETLDFTFRFLPRESWHHDTAHWPDSASWRPSHSWWGCPSCRWAGTTRAPSPRGWWWNASLYPPSSCLSGWPTRRTSCQLPGSHADWKYDVVINKVLRSSQITDCQDRRSWRSPTVKITYREDHRPSRSQFVNIADREDHRSQIFKERQDFRSSRS